MTDARSAWAELYLRFPLALADRLAPPHADITKMHGLALYGIECGVGWKPLVTELLETLEQEIATQPETDRADLRVVQIKEKLGQLRVYTATTATESMRAAISAAVDASSQICEVCSAPGERRSKEGWWATRCARHTDQTNCWAGQLR